MITSWLTLLAGLLMLAGACLPARASEAPRLQDLYSHRAWTAVQGAPAQIQAITQTPDGWLWLSTPTGLYRFDGLRFQRHDAIDGNALRSAIVLPLHTAPDGTLWVGYRFGGASAFLNGKVRHYDAAQGFPPGATHSFTAAPDGVIWVTTANGLAWLDSRKDRWIQVGADQGFTPVANIWQVLFDRAGKQWVSSARQVFYRRAGDARFQLASPANIPLASLAAAPDGTVWVSNGSNANYRLSYTTPATVPNQTAQAELPGSGMWFDRAGAMWLLSETHVERVPPGKHTAAVPDPLQQLAHDRGLSGMNPQTFYEDRDGNIWIGTATGLDQFRRNRAARLAMQRPVVTPPLAPAHDGQVWLSNFDSRAWLIDRDGAQHASIGRTFWASSKDAAGQTWLAGEAGIWRANDPAASLVAPPPGLRDSPVPRALTLDGSGALWVAYLGQPLLRYSSGVWQAPYPSLPQARIMALLSDSKQRLWAGYQGNRLVLIAQGKLRELGVADGLNIGNVLCIVELQGQLWVAGENGVARYDGQRLHTLRTRDGRALRGVSGMLSTANGDLWLHTDDGVVHVPVDQVQAFVRENASIGYKLLGSEEGLSGNVQPTGPFPSIIEASDGMLWVSTTSGAMLINPATIRRDSLPPAVQIVSVVSDGQTHTPDGPLRLPSGSTNLHLSFTAQGLSVPERVHFRYRLLGVDNGWQDAGTRREAFYTNLGPGDYRFQVIASNRDGVWNSSGDTLDIVIPPTFVQSLWFKALCALTVLALVVLAWRWRVAQMARMIEARLHERLHERERIARALHDTFLQEAQGTVLMMHTAMVQIPPSLPARAVMERGIGYIEQAMIEGRDEVMGLRSSARADEPLAVALQRYGERLASGLPPDFHLLTRGTPRRLAPLVKDELFSIAREAIWNAFRHAEASEIELELNFEASNLTLTVSDNGHGIPADTLAHGVQGHWGMVGMRERAAHIGATLEVGNRSSGGAYIRLTLPLGYGSV
ncbi:MAG: two-component regulator propeller domain-containing protein [Duganella sp.]